MATIPDEYLDLFDRKAFAHGPERVQV